MKVTMPDGDIDALFARKALAAERVLLSVLTEIGLRCLKEARNNGSYTDQTGNLRSSIGFCVLKNGKIVKEIFANDLNDGKPASSEGVAESKSALSSLIPQYTSSEYCLIIVAGMNYAVYVEGRGKDVLTSAELLAGRLVPQLLVQLGFKDFKVGKI